eukprot:2472474-Pleurochrysis_carterae.AAC.1
MAFLVMLSVSRHLLLLPIRAADLLMAKYGAHEDLPSGRCCHTCHSSQHKFYSVDIRGPMCGECCLSWASFFPVFKHFEPNMSLAEGDSAACAQQLSPNGTRYSRYVKTVVHGIWPVKVVVDMYAPELAGDFVRDDNATVGCIDGLEISLGLVSRAT